MRVQIPALIIVLAAVGCSTKASDKMGEADASSSEEGGLSASACEERQAAFRAAVANLSRSCSVDDDCETVVGIEECGCIGAASVDSDLEELSRTRQGFGNDCDNPFWCYNNSFCWHDGFAVNEFVASCVDGTCIPDPDFSCDRMDEIVAGAKLCEEDADCEVRSDVGACGCPTAVSTDASQALRHTARLRTKCDYSDVCAVIDCATGASARCVDRRCELVE